MADGKISDQGWFYHAPAKTRTTEPVQAPPLSQIPELGYYSSQLLNEDADGPKSNLRDTDSKYIRLCKMGGRPDLLKHDPFKTKLENSGKVPHTKNEWFYLEDNLAEDRMLKEQNITNAKWESRLPEYMVHEGFNAEEAGADEDADAAGATGAAGAAGVRSRGRGQGATAASGPWEGAAAPASHGRNDIIPEPKPFGYGVRLAKFKRNMFEKLPAVPLPQLAAPTETALNTRRLKHLEEPYSMAKILSYGYQRDWLDHSDTLRECNRGDALVGQAVGQLAPVRAEQPKVHCHEQVEGDQTLKGPDGTAARQRAADLPAAGLRSVPTDEIPHKASYKKMTTSQPDARSAARNQRNASNTRPW